LEKALREKLTKEKKEHEDTIKRYGKEHVATIKRYEDLLKAGMRGEVACDRCVVVGKVLHPRRAALSRQ
jgi:hypothetical protein